MMRFFRGGTGASAAAAKPALTLPSVDAGLAAGMHFSVHHWRSHTDIRPGASVVLVHDWLSTNAAWCPLVGAVQRTPQPDTELQFMEQQPLTMFCPDLPNHGKSGACASLKEPEDYASALVEFVHRVVPKGPVHVVGFGVGGTQIALLAAAGLPQPKLASFLALLGNCQTQKQQFEKPLVLDADLSVDLSQKINKAGDDANTAASSLHQVDDYFAAHCKFKSLTMSELARFNTGTSHCGATRWEQGVNLKGTPSLQAKSSPVRWNSNVKVLRELPDYGIVVGDNVAKLIASAAENKASDAAADAEAPTALSYIAIDQSIDIAGNGAAKLARSLFRKPEPNVAVLDALDGSARGPTDADAERICPLFLSLYKDENAAQALQQQQQQQMM